MIINGKTYVEEEKTSQAKAQRCIVLLKTLIPDNDALVQYINRPYRSSKVEVQDFLSNLVGDPGTIANLQSKIAALEIENKSLRQKLRMSFKPYGRECLNETDKKAMLRVAEILKDLGNMDEIMEARQEWLRGSIHD